MLTIVKMLLFVANRTNTTFFSFTFFSYFYQQAIIFNCVGIFALNNKYNMYLKQYYVFLGSSYNKGK